MTFQVFDPIRVFVIEGRLLEWFDYRSQGYIVLSLYPYANILNAPESGFYKWLRTNTVDRLSFALAPQESDAQESDLHTWKERRDAEEGIRAYLSDVSSASLCLVTHSSINN